MYKLFKILVKNKTYFKYHLKHRQRRFASRDRCCAFPEGGDLGFGGFVEESRLIFIYNAVEKYRVFVQNEEKVSQYHFQTNYLYLI